MATELPNIVENLHRKKANITSSQKLLVDLEYIIVKKLVQALSGQLELYKLISRKFVNYEPSLAS